MTERWICLDCNSLAPLTQSGTCSVCQSNAVVSEHSHRTEIVPASQQEIQELERWMAL
jgi:hypothetical protein